MKRRLKKQTKIIMIIVSVIILLAIIPIGSVAKDAIGSKIEISRIDGTAYVVKNGKKIEAKTGLKLSQDESLQTAAGSYVYISLDDTKVVKVDELSQINIEKKGKKLRLEVEEGSLFFNVTEKLEDDESMSIEASTMAMSIRGTSGIVSIRREGLSIISTVTLLDGIVQMTYSNEGGEKTNFELWGGEQIIYDEFTGEMVRDLIDITELPGFVAVELAADAKLTERLRMQSGLNAKWAIEHADELLTECQAFNLAKYKDVFEEGNITSVESRKRELENERRKRKNTPTPSITPLLTGVVSPSAAPGKVTDVEKEESVTPTITPESEDKGGSGNSNRPGNPNPTRPADPTATPTVTPIPDPTATPTPEPTATPEPTPEPTSTPEPTPEPTATPDPTSTPDPTETPSIRY